MANYRSFGWLQLTVSELDTLIDGVGKPGTNRQLRAVLNKVINVRNIARMEQLSAVTRVVFKKKFKDMTPDERRKYWNVTKKRYRAKDKGLPIGAAIMGK